MRIGVVLDNEFDADHRVQKQVKQLIENKHDVFVICFDFGKNYKSYSNFKVTRIPINQTLKNILVLLNNRFFFYEYLWVKNICKLINSYQLDAIHCHDLYMSRPSKKAIIKSKYNPVLTLDLHENYPHAINTYKWATKGWRKFIVKPKSWFVKEYEYLDYADNIVTLSESFTNNLKKKYPKLNKKKFVAHPNLFDFSNFTDNENYVPKTELEFNKITVLYFGVIAQRRGLLKTLPWIESLLNEGVDLHLLIIGPVDKADNKEFKKLLSLPKLSENHTYLKWIDIKELPYYLKKSAIALAPFEVNPQHDSGVANKIYQYMYGKIPVLASACEAQKELIENANCGYIFHDSQSFKKSLKTLVLNKTLRDRLGKNGYDKLVHLYNEKVDEKFIKLYH